MTTAERLEELRAAIRAENISYGELAELQGMADQIPPGDVELLEWAGTFLGRFETLRRAKAAVSVEMRRSGYFPNVFLVGEHGPTVRRIEVW